MPKARKKPVEIEYCEWNPAAQPTDLPEWLMNLLVFAPERFDEATGKLTIRTLEGDMTAQPGDIIIQGVKGEIYPIKPDIFEATYDRID